MPQPKDTANSYWFENGPWCTAKPRRTRQAVRKSRPSRTNIVAQPVMLRAVGADPPDGAAASAGGASRSPLAMPAATLTRAGVVAAARALPLAKAMM
jgi:hypothetical protein